MGEAYRTGGRGGRADTTERDISGRVTSLNSMLTQNRETIKDIDAQLKDLGSRKDEASLKQRDALTKQRNELNQDSEDIRKELSGIRKQSKFSGDGGGLSRDGYKAGDVVSYIDASGKTVQARFKGGENKQDNWEPITAGSTTNAPTGKGLEKPSGKGMSEKDYENWVDDKLIGTFTSRLQELQLIAKENPNPQIKAAAQRLLEKEKTKPQAGGVDAPL
jgi:TolA-binding protein